MIVNDAFNKVAFGKEPALLEGSKQYVERFLEFARTGKLDLKFTKTEIAFILAHETQIEIYGFDAEASFTYPDPLLKKLCYDLEWVTFDNIKLKLTNRQLLPTIKYEDGTAVLSWASPIYVAARKGLFRWKTFELRTITITPEAGYIDLVGPWDYFIKPIVWR